MDPLKTVGYAYSPELRGDSFSPGWISQAGKQPRKSGLTCGERGASVLALKTVNGKRVIIPTEVSVTHTPALPDADIFSVTTMADDDHPHGMAIRRPNG